MSKKIYLPVSSFSTFSIDSNDEYFITKNSLIVKLNNSQLQELFTIFIEKSGELSKNEFIEAIDLIFGNHLHSVEAACLFDAINKNNSTKISKDAFIDFVINILNPWKIKDVKLVLRNRYRPPHTQEEPIQKIVTILTEDYFCYVIISKYGSIGLYDVNLNFLNSYRSFFTKNHLLSKDEDNRIKKNRWVNDGIFLPNVSMLVLANSTGTVSFYDAARLKHYLIWMIINIPNVIQTLSYSYGIDHSVLLMGDDSGQIYILKFLNPSKGLFRKKFSDKPNVYVWNEVLDDKNNVEVTKISAKHNLEVLRIFYSNENCSIASCSKDPSASVIIQHVNAKWKPYIFKMKKGVNCFALEKSKRVMVTGSDGLIAIWDIFDVTRPTKILTTNSRVLDVALLTHFDMFVTFYEKELLELWDINSEKNVQKLRLKFPVNVKWGDNSKFNYNVLYVYQKNQYGHLKDQYTNFTIKKNEKNNIDEFLQWFITHIFVINTGYIANVIVKYSDMNNINYPVLRPPPLHNSVLIPLDWKIRDNTAVLEEQEKSNNKELEEIDDKAFEKIKNLFDHSAFTLKESHDINWKLSTLENEKLESNLQNLSFSAVFLNLKLQEVKEIKLSANIINSQNEEVHKTLERVSKLLEKAKRRDKIFYEDLTNRSYSRSSTSSIQDLF